MLRCDLFTLCTHAVTLSQYHSNQDNLLLLLNIAAHIHINHCDNSILRQRNLRVNYTYVILCAYKARSLASLRGWGGGGGGDGGGREGGTGIDRIIFVWRETGLEWTAKHLCNLFKLEKSNCVRARARVARRKRERESPPSGCPFLRAHRCAPTSPADSP